MLCLQENCDSLSESIGMCQKVTDIMIELICRSLDTYGVSADWITMSC